MFEHHVVPPGPVISLAHHLPHIARVAAASLAEGRDLLLTGERTGEVVTVEVPVGGEVLQSDLLAALHGFSSHTEAPVVRSLHRPVAVDVLLHIGPRHGLLTGPRAVLDVMRVQSHLRHNTTS